MAFDIQNGVLVKYTEEPGVTELVIPDGVNAIGRHALSYHQELTSVTIPEGVTTIDVCAFTGCDHLIHVAIPNSVRTIELQAFSGCKQLTSIAIPEGVHTVRIKTFSSCKSLQSVRLPSSLQSIEQDAFQFCEALSDITIPEGVTQIGHGAFLHCESLSSIAIPEGVTKIEMSTFSDCTRLTSVVLPESLKEIGYAAFSDCKSLTEIVIPEQMTIFGCYAFSGCENLTSLSILTKDPVVFAEFGAASFDRFVKHCPLKKLVCFNGAVLAKASADKEPLSFKIEDGYIPWSAFDQAASRFKAALLPCYLCSKEQYSSEDAEQYRAYIRKQAKKLLMSYVDGGQVKAVSGLLEDAQIKPEALQEAISKAARNREMMTLLLNWQHEHVDLAAEREKAERKMMRELSRPEPKPVVKKEKEKKLWHCRKEPDGSVKIIQYLGAEADVVIPDQLDGKVVSALCNELFRYNNTIVNITLPKGLKYIGRRAFSDCTNLKTITMSDSVSEFDKFVFSGCKKLVSVNILDCEHNPSAARLMRHEVPDRVQVTYNGQAVLK